MVETRVHLHSNSPIPNLNLCDPDAVTLAKVVNAALRIRKSGTPSANKFGLRCHIQMLLRIQLEIWLDLPHTQAVGTGGAASGHYAYQSATHMSS